MSDPTEELLVVAGRNDLKEVGGSHNQKGIEYQRHWAVLRMFELDAAGAEDFLLLIEALQDVAILDSAAQPTTVEVCQIKKKDRKEWTWAELTALQQPGKRRAKNADFPVSPLGKLYRTINSFSVLKASGRFVSNAGCDIPLADGSNVASALPSKLCDLDPKYVSLLAKEIASHGSPSPPDLLDKIYLERSSLAVNDPGTHVVGVIAMYLSERSPKHAAQAWSLLSAFLARLGSLGARTEPCKTFEEMRRQHGYTKEEFLSALDALNEVPDVDAHLELWLRQLLEEGFSLIEVTSIRAAAAAILRSQLLAQLSEADEALIEQCDAWLDRYFEGKGLPTQVASFVEQACVDLSSDSHMKKARVQAHFIIRVIHKCVDQI